MGNNKKILLVEDDGELADQIENAINRNDDYEIVKCHSADNAAILLKGNNFDLLILDIMLPDTDVQFKRIKSLNDELKDINNKIKIEKDNITKMKLREDRQDILFEINENINIKGGLDIAKEYNVLHKIKAKKTIMFLTAVNDPQRIEEAKEFCDNAGIIFDWLCKPALAKEIVGKINNILLKE